VNEVSLLVPTAFASGSAAIDHRNNRKKVHYFAFLQSLPGTVFAATEPGADPESGWSAAASGD